MNTAMSISAMLKLNPIVIYRTIMQRDISPGINFIYWDQIFFNSVIIKDTCSYIR